MFLRFFKTFLEGSADHVIYRDHIMNRRFFIYCSLTYVVGRGMGEGGSRETDLTQTLMTVQLEADMSSLSCLKKEKNKSKKRRLANKLLGTRDAAKCKE